jgi:hypothetical protein
MPHNFGNLIRCDSGHALVEHSDAGCIADQTACRCRQTPFAIVLDEIAVLRPEWLAPNPTA